MYNWKKHYAIKKQYEKTIGKDITEDCGIYVWTRTENDITYFYVGQAKNLRNRRFDYYKIQCGIAYPTRHFEASLKKHKDWQFKVIETCPIGLLDAEEERLIKEYNLKPGYVTRNELLTGNEDQVRTNYRRKEQIEKKAISGIRKCLEYVCITTNDYSLIIDLKTNKNGTYNALSKKYFEKLKEILGIGGKNEENKPI